MCRHEQAQLVGQAHGILCRGCGRIFPDFAAIERDREPPQDEQAAETAPTRGKKKKEGTG